jgi:predicted DNA-binding protein (MmcQ/YjbR family)
MTLESLRGFCRTLPHVAEDVKWDDNLCFLIAGKMFAITSLDPAAAVKLSFRCSPEGFADLVERDGVVPAPYLARYHWVALERWDALRDAELRDAIRESHRLVWAGLPRKLQARLG